MIESFRREIFIQLPIVYILTWVLPLLLIATCLQILAYKEEHEEEEIGEGDQRPTEEADRNQLG